MGIFSKKKGLKVYGYDNCEGDKGIIIAKNYSEAVKTYKQAYDRNITEEHSEYMEGGCYLSDLGVVKENKVYVNAEW